MKGLNIKKIAAIGLGAALVGSALAPVVSAANMVPNGLSGLARDHIVDSTGAPVVDVVVGSGAAVSDVVWAGNIAAKVAQLATTSTGAGGAVTVDVTVGGTQSTAGNGQTVESVMDFSAQEATFNGIQVTDSKMEGLVNETSAKLTWAGTEYTTTVKEVLKATADAKFQNSTSSSAYASGELYASIAAGDLNYSVELGNPGIPLAANAYKNLDGNADYDVQLPLLGKIYVLDETTADSLILYADTTPTDLQVGDKIPVTAGTANVGKTVEIQLVDLIQIGSGNTTYEPKWALLVDGVATKYVQQAATTSYDLRTQFGKTQFTDSIYVTAAGLNLAAGTYTATVRTGDERLELKNGKGFPYMDDSDVDNYSPWKVTLTGNPVTKITIQNQWAYTKTSGTESDNSNTKFVKLVGEEVVLPNDFATFKYVGLQSKPTTELQVGDVSGISSGGIRYVDLRGNTIDIPFYVQFDMDFNIPKEISIAGIDYTFWMHPTTTNGPDSNISYIKGKYSDAVSPATWVKYADVNSNTIATNGTGVIGLELGAETATGTTILTDYIWVQDSNSGTGRTVGLVLRGNQDFNLENNGNLSVPKLKFLGTTYGATAAHVAAYVPNTEDFMNTILNSSQGAWASTKNFSADFNYVDNANDAVTLFLETDDTAKVWEYKSIKGTDNNNLGPSLDANSVDWSIGTDVSTPLYAAYTEDGTMVESDGARFTLIVPDQNRPAEMYLGGTDTSTVTIGGQQLTGIAVGGYDSTPNGTKVTVDAVSGSVGGVNVVAVPNLVKIDQSTYGKSIVVGGWLVNAAAEMLEVSQGNTLEDLITAQGDYVAAVLNSGDIVVAGYSAADTGAAASQLINALEDLI